ncbi:MAG: glycosyltransferase family 2 protein [Acidaminococcaceae bacterium]|nr:glycosyltransferase family 2 protein [Acidaminococcaceae bacterium]
MPVYNMKDYVRESIDSVLTSTYKDLELILVDDGSTDGSSELCDEIAKVDMERIKVFHIDNHGVSYARNYGIERSAGQYILPVDADDLIDKTYIEKAVQIIQTDEQIGIVYCEAKQFGKVNKIWDLPKISVSEILHRNIIFVTALFRKSDWKKVGGFSEDFFME